MAKTSGFRTEQERPSTLGPSAANGTARHNFPHRAGGETSERTRTFRPPLPVRSGAIKWHRAPLGKRRTLLASALGASFSRPRCSVDN